MLVLGVLDVILGNYAWAWRGGLDREREREIERDDDGVR